MTPEEKNKKKEQDTAFANKFWMYIFGIFILMVLVGTYIEMNATPEQRARWAAERLKEAKKEAREKKIKAQKAFKTRCNQGSAPFVMVQNAVKSRLKSPSSAKFPVLESKTVLSCHRQIKYLGRGHNPGWQGWQLVSGQWLVDKLRRTI